MDSLVNALSKELSDLNTRIMKYETLRFEVLEGVKKIDKPTFKTLSDKQDILDQQASMMRNGLMSLAYGIMVAEDEGEITNDELEETTKLVKDAANKTKKIVEATNDLVSQVAEMVKEPKAETLKASLAGKDMTADYVATEVEGELEASEEEVEDIFEEGQDIEAEKADQK